MLASAPRGAGRLGGAGRTGGEIEGRTLAACGEVGGGHGGGVPVHGPVTCNCLDRVTAWIA